MKSHTPEELHAFEQHLTERLRMQGYGEDTFLELKVQEGYDYDEDPILLVYLHVPEFDYNMNSLVEINFAIYLIASEFDTERRSSTRCIFEDNYWDKLRLSNAA